MGDHPALAPGDGLTARRRGLALFAAAAALVGVLPERAAADADPASDVLITVDVFLSFQAPTASNVGRDLLALTAAARRAHHPIKVAVIVQPADLGGVPQLFNKPAQYAKFLGSELSFTYLGTLVVAMPAGFGVVGPFATPATKRALRALPPPGRGNAGHVGTAAVAAVRRVAAANGLRLPAPKSSSGGLSPLYIALAITLSVLFAAALTEFTRRRRVRLK